MKTIVAPAAVSPFSGCLAQTYAPDLDLSKAKTSEVGLGAFKRSNFAGYYLRNKDLKPNANRLVTKFATTANKIAIHQSILPANEAIARKPMTVRRICIQICAHTGVTFLPETEPKGRTNAEFHLTPSAQFSAPSGGLGSHKTALEPAKSSSRTRAVHYRASTRAY
jgi:hypothetical protein